MNYLGIPPLGNLHYGCIHPYYGWRTYGKMYHVSRHMWFNAPTHQQDRMEQVVSVGISKDMGLKMGGFQPPMMAIK